MKHSPALTAALVELAAKRARRARVAIVGRSMEPLLRAGMVVDIEPLGGEPRLGDILVFRSQSGLVAHRFVGRDRRNSKAPPALEPEQSTVGTAGIFLTAGDAQPERVERLPPRSVVGRVRAVWASATPNAARIDDRRYRRLGVYLARTRALRALFARGRAKWLLTRAIVLDGPAKSAPPPAFAVLVAATRPFERADYARGVSLLESIPRPSLIDMARRHHMSGFICGWLDEATRNGVAVPPDLSEWFRRIRWTNAIQTGRVLACVRDVRDRFVVAEIPHIFLKGGARLAAGRPGADIQYSGDVDVIVPVEFTEKARDTLRDAGYRTAKSHGPTHHHDSPLLLPGTSVPVEIHWALERTTFVSRRLDYAALQPFARRVDGPIGAACVLDDLGSAIHLAYHAREFSVWRDVVLLSRLLRTFDAASHRSFAAWIAGERRDGLRLASAVAAAESLAFDATISSRAIQRYIAWAQLREDLPRALKYCDIVEAVVGRCRPPKLRLEAATDPILWLRYLIRTIISLPSILRHMRLRNRAKDRAR